MGTIRKIGDAYYVEFEARGLKYQQKAGQDEAVARSLLAEIESQIARGEMRVLERETDVEFFLQGFLEDARSHHPPKTIQRFRSVCEHFQKFLKLRSPVVQRLSQVTPKVLEDYRAHLLQETRVRNRPLRPSAFNLTFILLREIMEFAINLGYLNDNPALHARLIKIPIPSWWTVLSDEEQRLVTDHDGRLLCLIFEFMLRTGLTSRQVIKLKWHELDFEQEAICFGIGSPPDNCSAFVPMDTRVAAILKQRKADPQRHAEYVFVGVDRQKFRNSAIIEAFKVMVQSRKMRPGLKISCLRHTFAQNVLAKRVPLTKLYKFLRFDDVGKAMMYFPILPGLH